MLILKEDNWLSWVEIRISLKFYGNEAYKVEIFSLNKWNTLGILSIHDF